MRKLYIVYAMLGLLLGVQGLQAQKRYLEPVFSRSDIKVTFDVTYGTNVSILPIILGQDSLPQPTPLLMNVYEPDPAVDTLSERPLILFGVTGNFLPKIVNSGFTGERDDSAVVEIARRFTELGYVVAVVQYRRGWNPLGSETEAQKTILQAAYRGIQDMRNVVRFFRWSVDQDGNPYGVDVDRIAVGGTGTGAYVAYGATYLSDFNEILLQKFIDFDLDPPAPFIDTLVHGDINGVKPALLNIPNYEEYPSNINVGFGLDGAVGDVNFINEGDPPFIAVHSACNALVPYDIGDVITENAATGLPFSVIPTAAGGLGALREATELGLQDVFRDVEWDDPFSPIAAARSEGVLGLMPLITPTEEVGEDAMCDGVGVPGDTLTHYDQPWAWFNEAAAAQIWNLVFAAEITAGTRPTAEQAICQNTRTIPNDPDIARAYIDTVIGFLAPRLALVLNVEDTSTATSINRFIQDKNVEVFPNPAKDHFSVSYRTGSKQIGEVTLMDYTGRVLQKRKPRQAATVDIPRGDLPTGIYLLRIQVGDNFVARRIMLE